MVEWRTAFERLCKMEANLLATGNSVYIFPCIISAVLNILYVVF